MLQRPDGSNLLTAGEKITWVHEQLNLLFRDFVIENELWIFCGDAEFSHIVQEQFRIWMNDRKKKDTDA